MPILRHVEGKTHATIQRALARYGCEEIEALYQFGTDIDRARCFLADRALDTTAEWFIFCDSDAVPPCGSGPFIRGLGYEIPEPNASMNAIERILSAPEDQKILSALCFLRRLPMVAACATGVAGGPEAVALVRAKSEPGETGTIEQDWVGMHFCRIHRSVFEEMRKYIWELAPKTKGGPWGYFLKLSAEESEDGSFCKRADSIGIQSYVDTALRVGHITNIII